MKKIRAFLLTFIILSVFLPLPCTSVTAASFETSLFGFSPGGDSYLVYLSGDAGGWYRSTDYGSDWEILDIADQFNGNYPAAIKFSTDYQNDQTLWVATTSRVYRSVDGGLQFSALPALPGSGRITSLDINSAGDLLVGTTTDSGGGGVFLYQNSAWTDLQIGDRDVFAVAFSPDYASDNLTLAVTDNNTAIQLESLYAGESWNQSLRMVSLFPGSVESADLAFAADYDHLDSNYVFVTVNGEGSGGVEERGPGFFLAYLSAQSGLNDWLEAPAGNDFYSVAVTRNMSDGYIGLGPAVGSGVQYAAIQNADGINWSDSSQPPEGAAWAQLDYVNTYTLAAVTSGSAAGLFISWDYGDHFWTLLQPVNGITPIDDLNVSVEDYNSITLTWTSPENAAGYYDIRYMVNTSITALNWESAGSVDDRYWVSEPGSTETYTLKGLQPGTHYYFGIKTGEAWSWSAVSNSTDGNTLEIEDSTPPLMIEDLAVTASGSNALTLEWTAPGDGEDGGTGGEYSEYPPDGAIDIPVLFDFVWSEEVNDFQLAGAPDFADLLVDQTNLGEPTWSLTSALDYGTTYTWRIGYNYGEDESSWWIMTFTTVAAPTEHTGYDIRYLTTDNLNDDFWDSAYQVSGEPTPEAAGRSEQFSVTGLESETTYYLGIKTRDEAGNWSDISNIASGTTRDTTPPAAITNLRATSVSSSSVTLVWTASGDDGNNGTASQYDLRYSSNPNLSFGSWNKVTNEPSPAAAGTRESLTVYNLNSGTTYYFRIKVADEVPNWSGISNLASARTSGGVVRTTTPTPTPEPTPEAAGPVQTTSYNVTVRSTGVQTAGPLFSVTGLTLSGTPVKTGEKVTATATLVNNGDLTGSYTAFLLVNGLWEGEAQEIVLEPGKQTSISFELQKDAAGMYEIQVGEQSASLEVVKTVRAWIWILLALLLLLIILLILRQVLHWGFKGEKNK